MLPDRCSKPAKPRRVSWDLVRVLLGAVPLLVTGVARAEPTGADGAIVEAAAVATVGQVTASSRYTQFPWEAEPGATPSTDRQRALGYGGAVEASVGKRLNDRWIIAGTLRVGKLATPSPFSETRRTHSSWLAGPRLTSATADGSGLFVTALAAVAKLEGYGGHLALGAGYRQAFAPGGFAGVRIEASGEWTRYSEDGDRGEYQFDDRMVGLSLIASIGWQ